jgi:hypothetical protein
MFAHDRDDDGLGWKGSGEMSEHITLNQALGAARAALDAQHAPASARERLLAAFDAQRGEMPLAQALDAARAALDAEQPPAHVRAQLLAAFERQRLERAAAGGAPRAQRRFRWAAVTFAWGRFAAWSGAVASLALVATVGFVLLGGGEAASTGAAATARFIPTVPAERLAQETQRYVVTADMTRDMLASMGLPVDASRGAEPVRAEMLMSGSGDVLAVRFVES